MNVAAGFGHDAANGVAALADDVRMVCVRNVHLDRDSATLGVQVLNDHGLGRSHALFLSTDTNMRI